MASCTGGVGGDIDDIEDWKGTDVSNRAEGRTPSVVRRTLRRGHVESKDGESKDVESKDERAAELPGKQKLWIRTFGCSHNVSDSEYMEGILQAYGYRFTEKKEEADLWLVNSCTVKDPSQAAFANIVVEAQKTSQPIVVAGCVPQGDKRLKVLEGVSVVGVTQIDRVVEVVEETLKGNQVRLLGKSSLPRLDLPKVRRNRLVEIIPLSTGCLGACTYCKTKHARGVLGSYEPRAIVSRAQQVVKEGVSEVWLSSEDTGAYGRDIGTDMPALLRGITQVLPPLVMLRVGMTNPPFMLDRLEGIAEALNHPNVYKFLHIPVQSGSNAVLEAMYREYTVEEFRTVVDQLTVKVPGLTVATDIICGFPGETEADFDETLKLIDDYKLAIVNISQFYPRPGTPAARMKQLHPSVKKSRSRRLTALFMSFDPYRDMVGRVERVWCNTEVSKDGTQTVGHTANYTKVVLPRDDTLMGQCVTVKIESASRFHVAGAIVKGPEATLEDIDAFRKELGVVTLDNPVLDFPTAPKTKSATGTGSSATTAASPSGETTAAAAEGSSGAADSGLVAKSSPQERALLGILFLLLVAVLAAMWMGQDDTEL